ncbi:MAG: hypothetical protein ACRD3G_11500 [Vicinamibacterales bacterium]
MPPTPGFLVLEAHTPPDPTQAVAIFLVGDTQDANSASTRATAFRDAHFPTSIVQPCTVDDVVTAVVLNP